MLASSQAVRIFSVEAHVRRIVEFEVALALAGSEAGTVPHDAAATIAARCDPERVVVDDALLAEAAATGTIVPPLLRRLHALIADDRSAQYLHRGATSQDAIDTASMLQMRAGLDLLERELIRIGRVCAALAESHRGTPMVGRTLLQQAAPITFGLKAARWLSLLTRAVERVRRVEREGLALQLGGATGTLAAFGEHGLAVADDLGRRLGLPVPPLPWHAERDRVADIVGVLAIVAGSVAKIAQDLVLLAQTEVGEATPTRDGAAGTSSAMPYKRNPSEAVAAGAAARMGLQLGGSVATWMAHEHERAAGGWQAEWAAVPGLFGYVTGALEWLAKAFEVTSVDEARMRATLNAAAHTATEPLSLPIGSTDAFIDRALDAYRRVSEGER